MGEALSGTFVTPCNLFPLTESNESWHIANMAVNMVSTILAVDMLRDCLSDGNVITGKHFLDELQNEGLTVLDAWQVLRTGCISKPPEPDIRTGEWKYTIEGYAPDGQWLAIVFSFKEIDRAYLITVFSVAMKGRG